MKQLTCGIRVCFALPFSFVVNPPLVKKSTFVGVEQSVPLGVVHIDVAAAWCSEEAAKMHESVPAQQSFTVTCVFQQALRWTFQEQYQHVEQLCRDSLSSWKQSCIRDRWFSQHFTLDRGLLEPWIDGSSVTQEAWTWTVSRCPICHQRSSACRATASCFCVCDTLLSLLARPQRARSWPHPAKHPPTDPMLVVGSADTTSESLRDSQRQSSRKFKTAPLPCKDVSMISNQRTACAQSVCVHTSTVTSKVYYVSVSNSTSETTDQDSHRKITWCTCAHSVPWFHVVQVPPALLYKDVNQRVATERVFHQKS